MTNEIGRESVPEPPNALGFHGIEFIEFATSDIQAAGAGRRALPVPNMERLRPSAEG